MKKYDIIYADPPWKYGSRGARSGRFAELDYSTMSTVDLCDMDIQSISNKDCSLHMWATGSFMTDAITVGNSWGFKFIRLDKVWHKIKPSGKIHAVCGPWGMSDCEFILLFTKGKMCGKQKGKRNQYTLTQEIHAGLHSGKPRLFRDQIDVRYESGLNKLEMFARTENKGWEVFGNEVENSIKIGQKNAQIKAVKFGLKG